MATTNKVEVNQGVANCEFDIPKGGKLYYYSTNILTTRIILHISQVGQDTKKNLEDALADIIGGRCCEEGYIKANSIKIQSFSSGQVRAENIEFHVVYQAQVSLPVEGQVLEATVRTITKAGIHAQCIDQDGEIPITVFIARDHHNNNQEFEHVKEGDHIHACVIGSRFELNDPYICVIAKYIAGKYSNKFPNNTTKTKLRIGGEVEVDLEEEDPMQEADES